MKFTKNHLRLVILGILIFVMSIIINATINPISYRDKHSETENEFELLSYRTSLIQERQYMSTTKIRDEEMFHYTTRTYSPYSRGFSRNRGFAEVNSSDRVYILSGENYEEILEKQNIKNISSIEYDPLYKSRLPLEYNSILGNYSMIDNSQYPALIVFTKDDSVLSYFHVDSRIIDFGEFVEESGYSPYETFYLKLDSKDKLYIDKVENRG